MTIEISVESYLFTCARCATRWVEDYQVSQQIDDAGALRSFYRHHGDPCEAPVSGNVACPNCHATRVLRDPLYGTAPDLRLTEPAEGLLAVPVQRSEEVVPLEVPVAVRRSAHRVWHRFKFAAVVTLETARCRGGEYLSGVPGLIAHAPSVRQPARHQYFPAIVRTDDDRPLRPGDRGLSVVMSVPDDDAAGFFQPGQRFALWDGADVGHGTVATPLYFQGP
jgi:hypothetical protein